MRTTQRRAWHSLSLLLLVLLSISVRTAFGANSVTLAWDASTSSNLAGYRVYYGTASRNYSTNIDVGNVTTYTLANLAPGTYYFAVTAYNTLAEQSGYSNEASVTIAGACTYSVSVSIQSTGAASTTGSATVTAGTGCAWTASSNVPWIAITSGSSGTGNGVVDFSIASNTTSSSRSGTLTIAGYAYTITQAKAGCDVNLDGSVNFSDIQVLINVLLGAEACPGNCDINGDGKVDITDLQTLADVVLGVRACP